MVRKLKKEKEIQLEDIPGVGEKIAKKLREVGFADPMAIAVASPSELAAIAEIGAGQAAKIINAVREMLEIGFEPADKILERKEKALRITTGSKNLDNLLGGGVQTQCITETYAPYGCGKTQLGFQLAVNVQLPPERGGLKRACLWIDSENTFSPSRIMAIAKALKFNPEEALKNVYVARAFNTDHQIFLVEKSKDLIEEKNIGLIVVDSLTSHFRADFIGRGMLAERQQKLNKHLHTLQRYADAFNLAVYVTNQVMARPDVLFGDATAPVGGHVLGHMCLPKYTFVITEDGLKEIGEVHNPMSVFGYLNKFDYYDIWDKAERIGEVVEINHTLQASPEHRVFVFRKNEGFKEIPASEIKKGDYLILPRKIDVEEKEFKIKIVNQKREKVKEVRKLNSSLAQFFGYFVGNELKCFCENSIKIKDKRKSVLKFYCKLLAKIFGIKCKMELVKKERCYEFSIRSCYVREVLKYLLENLTKLFICKRKIIKSFVQGLFDAKISSSISLTCGDKKFLIFLKLLLLRLGIHSTLATLSQNYWRLEVSKKDFRKIGFTANDKRNKLKTQRVARSELIPLTKGFVKRIAKEIGIKVKVLHPEGFITFNELQKLCENDKVNQIFGNLLNFYFEKVFSIEPKFDKLNLVDIETTCKNFLANGYLVHNSTYRLYLRKGRGGTRIARLVDAPDLPEAEAVFKITEEGIRDA